MIINARYEIIKGLKKTNEKNTRWHTIKSYNFFTHTLCRAVQYYRFFIDIYDGRKILKSIFLIAKKNTTKNKKLNWQSKKLIS